MNEKEKLVHAEVLDSLATVTDLGVVGDATFALDLEAGTAIATLFGADDGEVIGTFRVEVSVSQLERD